MKATRFGAWDMLHQILRSGDRVAGVAQRTLSQEAHHLRKLIVQGLTQQAPGGEPIRPLSPLTLAARRLKGFGGSKALIVRADLRNSVAVVAKGDTVFVGVLRRARGRGGRLVDLAAVHEFGGPPVIVPITPKMRRFLGVLRRLGGGSRGRSHAKGRSFVLIAVPPRPFLRPARRLFDRGLKARFMARLARNLGWGTNHD